MTDQQPTTRVRAGAYEAAAVALTVEHGEFDCYMLADRVQGHGYVSSRSAGRWIRRQARATGMLRQLTRGVGGRHGAPARYAVVQVVLNDHARRAAAA